MTLPEEPITYVGTVLCIVITQVRDDIPKRNRGYSVAQLRFALVYYCGLIKASPVPISDGHEQVVTRTVPAFIFNCHSFEPKLWRFGSNLLREKVILFFFHCYYEAGSFTCGRYENKSRIYSLKKKKKKPLPSVLLPTHKLQDKSIPRIRLSRPLELHKPLTKLSRAVFFPLKNI